MSLLQTSTIDCPYCGEAIEIVVDTTVPEQSYVEDCPVCCQPMLLQVTVDNEGGVDVVVRREND